MMVEGGGSTSADLRRIVGEIDKNSPRKGAGGEEKDRFNWKGGEIRRASGLQTAVLLKGGLRETMR